MDWMNYWSVIIPWNCAFLEEDVDICTEGVNDLLLAAADICIPAFQRRIQGEGWGGCSPPPPWGKFSNMSGYSSMMKKKAYWVKDISFPKSLGSEVRKTLWQSTDRELPKNLLLIAIGDDCDEDAFPTSIAIWSFPAPYRSQAQKLSDRFHWWNESRPALGQQCLKTPAEKRSSDLAVIAMQSSSKTRYE